MAMAQCYSFDADEVIRQIREAADRGLEVALASTSDPTKQAHFHAQHALLPAQKNFIRVHLDLRSAGRDDHFIAQVAGYLAGAVLNDTLMNSRDPAESSRAFFEVINRILSRCGTIASDDCEVVGTPAGRA